MNDTVEYAARPGKLWLSFIAFAGLTLLSAFIWSSAPGLVILVMVPALATCAYQMIVTPIYGLRMGRQEWVILDGKEDRAIPANDIAYLKVAGRGDITRATVVLQNGAEVDIPVDLTRDPLDLIKDVTDRGIPVRTG